MLAAPSAAASQPSLSLSGSASCYAKPPCGCARPTASAARRCSFKMSNRTSRFCAVAVIPSQQESGVHANLSRRIDSQDVHRKPFAASQRRWTRRCWSSTVSSENVPIADKPPSSKTVCNRSAAAAAAIRDASLMSTDVAKSDSGGPWRSNAVIRYLDECELEEDVALEAALHVEDEEWID